MKSKRIFTVFVGLVLVLLVGCGEKVTSEVVVTRVVTEVPSCTLLGCQDSLTIGLTDAWPESFSIDVVYEVGGENMQVTQRCENGRWTANDQPCTEIQLEAAPAAVVITAQWGENSITQEYTPDYEPFRPNGPGCEPVCQMSTITFAFPK